MKTTLIVARQSKKNQEITAEIYFFMRPASPLLRTASVLAGFISSTQTPLKSTRAHDEGDKELRQMGSQGRDINAGHGQVGKAHVVQHLGCVGVQMMRMNSTTASGRRKPEEAAQHRGQGP